MDGKQEVIRSLTVALDSMESVETIEELQDVLLDLRDNLDFDLKIQLRKRRNIIRRLKLSIKERMTSFNTFECNYTQLILKRLRRENRRIRKEII